MTPEGAMTDVRDVTTFGEALMRRWLLILLVAVVAPAIAFGATVRMTKVYEAQAQVYVDPQADPTALQASDGLLSRDYVQEVTSDAVLARSSSYLHGQQSAGWLATHVTAAPLTGSNVIGITARAGTATDAATIANAVSRAVVDQNASDAQGRMQATVQYLTSELAQVSAAITAAAGRPDAIATLRSEYDTTYTNLENARLAQSHAADALSVLQPAQAPARPVSPDPARDALIAMVAGLSVAVLAALLLERAGDRIHRPDALAAAAGTPLVLPMRRGPSNPHRIAYMQLRARFPELHVVMVVAVSEGRDADEAAADLGAAAASTGRNALVIQTGRKPPRRLPSVTGLTVWHVADQDDLRLVLHQGWGHELVVVAVPSPMRGAHAASIAGHVDATVLVASERLSRRAEAREAAAQLRLSGFALTAGLLLPHRRRRSRRGGDQVTPPPAGRAGAPTAVTTEAAPIPVTQNGDHR